MIKVCALCLTYFLQLHKMFTIATFTQGVSIRHIKNICSGPALVKSPKSVIKLRSWSAVWRSRWVVSSLLSGCWKMGKPGYSPYTVPQGNFTLTLSLT